MSYGIRQDFYNSKIWKDVRKAIWLKQNLLCNRCGKSVYVSGISDYLPKEKRRTALFKITGNCRFYCTLINQLSIFQQESPFA